MITIVSILRMGRKSATRVMALAAACSIAPVTVSGADKRSSVAESNVDLFRSLDKDKDGRVTLAEVSDAQKSFFRRALRVADANLDGALTATELTAALTDPQPVVIPTMLQPGRGVMQALMERRAAENSAAKPGSTPEIKPAEMAKDGARTDRAKTDGANKSRSADKAKTPERGRPQAAGQPGSDPAEMFSRIDRNRDGELTGDEIPARMKENLSWIDANQNGSVSRAEFLRIMQQMTPNSTPRQKKKSS